MKLPNPEIKLPEVKLPARKRADDGGAAPRKRGLKLPGRGGDGDEQPRKKPKKQNNTGRAQIAVLAVLIGLPGAYMFQLKPRQENTKLKAAEAATQTQAAPAAGPELAAGASTRAAVRAVPAGGFDAVKVTGRLRDIARAQGATAVIRLASKPTADSPAALYTATVRGSYGDVVAAVGAYSQTLRFANGQLRAKGRPVIVSKVDVHESDGGDSEAVLNLVVPVRD